ncbi:synaptotagmin-2 isoform X2 [Lampris incognitus]|uniref:synaptotagmin-2 isoform X2 n=1 Tax=Lampris incognitus TaxID=2546036 RepID=UPI0024B4CDCB|nr:synaptotagmin-2 isoform X2 [Lampris incognitus]
MLMPMDFIVPQQLSASSGFLRMPFSDQVKYSILSISVAFVLLALGILLWQVIRWCRQSQSIQHTANTGRVSRHNSLTSGNYSGAPSTKVEDVGVEARRLSRWLSLGSFPTSAATLAGSDLEEQAELKTVHGCLHFSLYYDQLQSHLVVTVLQAEGLKGRSQSNSLHPFVRLRLMSAGSKEEEMVAFVNEEGEEGSSLTLWSVLQEWRTRIVKDSSNPLFGDQFSYCLLQEELSRTTLRMEVRDFDKFSRHMVLGEVRVPLRQLKLTYPLELQEDLQTPQKDLVGEVLLCLKYLPTSQRLEVGVLKLRTGLTETSSALCAKVSVQCNQCKRRHQKTSTKARCHVTVFNQVLVFPLPEFPLEECIITVSVYENRTARRSSKHLIGQLSVGKGKSFEDQHWSLMMRSVRQPIAKWHGLFT